MRVSKWARIFGAVFLILGALGFVPVVTTADNYRFGLFHVNAALNIVYILTGVAFFAAGVRGEWTSKTTFRVMAVVYGIMAVLGFFYGPAPLFGLIANNVANTWLHVLVALGSAYFGFITRPAREHRPPFSRTRTSP